MDSSDDESEIGDDFQCYNCGVYIGEYEDDAWFDLDFEKYFCEECFEFIQINK